MYSSPIYYLTPLLIVIWFYCLYDIASSKFERDKDKLIYLLLVGIVPFIGIPLYLIFWRSKKKGKLDKSIF